MINHKKCDLQLSINTLTDISRSFIEHHEILDSISVLHFIDYYRAYLQEHKDRGLRDAPLVDFESFITNQTLLNSASSYISAESGEQQATTPAATNDNAAAGLKAFS